MIPSAPAPAARPGRLAREVAGLLGAAAVLAGLLRLAQPGVLAWDGPPPGADELTFTQAMTLAQARPVLWVDARPAAHFAAGHLPGAVSLTEDHWEPGFAALLERWTPDHAVIVYCDSAACRASHEVAARLRERGGLPEVHTLHGGWAAVPAAARDVPPRATP